MKPVSYTHLEVMDHIVPNYVVGFVYGALVEAFSCEQNARMMAMEGATNSAKQMLKELDIEYNRARQAAITQEITEVDVYKRQFQYKTAELPVLFLMRNKVVKREMVRGNILESVRMLMEICLLYTSRCV